jgi:ferric-dicitrate binding protein FerR (iron transport regulator)
MKTDDKQKQLEDFVLSHYQQGKLDTQKALRNVRERLQQREDQRQEVRIVPLWQRLRHIAAAVVLVLVMVSAYAIYRSNANHQSPSATTPQPTAITQPSQPKSFHFDNTPINQVLAELDAYYDLQLSASDTTKHLSGDFEAESPEMLIDMIEQTLGIEVKRSE